MLVKYMRCGSLSPHLSGALFQPLTNDGNMFVSCHTCQAGDGELRLSVLDFVFCWLRSAQTGVPDKLFEHRGHFMSVLVSSCLIISNNFGICYLYHQKLCEPVRCIPGQP